MMPDNCVVLEEVCPKCGTNLHLFTSLPGLEGRLNCSDGYNSDCDHLWHATDDDPVVCPACKYATSMSCDGESAWVRDELTLRS